MMHFLLLRWAAVAVLLLAPASTSRVRDDDFPLSADEVALGGAVLLENASAEAAGEVSCDLCPKGQQDSRECKDMFTAWMTCVSVYNALVPGVPADLALCCPCMTMRFFSSAPDVTAMAPEDVGRIFGERPARAAATTQGLRAAGTMRIYKEKCQRSFGASEKFARTTSLHKVVNAADYHLRAFARKTGIKDTKKAIGAGVRSTVGAATREQECRAIEDLHPELAYFWAEELLTEVCPTLVPYAVEVQLADKTTDLTKGLPVSAEQRKLLRDFVTDEALLKELQEHDVKEAGRLFAERLLEAAKKGRFAGWTPADDDAVVDLVSLKTEGEEPLEGDLSGDQLQHLDDLLDDLQLLQETAPQKPVNDVKTLQKHLRVLRLLRRALQQADPTEAHALLRALDPLGLLELPAGEKQLLGLRIAGFRLPGMAESSSAAYSSGTATLFGGLFSFAAVQTAVATGAAFGATVGTVGLPVVGTVGVGVAGAIVGAAAGMVLGGAASAASIASQGTVILQGWRVVAGSEFLGAAKLPRSPEALDRVFAQHLASRCKLYVNRKGHTQALHQLYSTPWRKAGKDKHSAPVAGDLDFWEELTLAAGIVREVHLERGSWETEAVSLPRRAARRRWLETAAQSKAAEWRELLERSDGAFLNSPSRDLQDDEGASVKASDATQPTQVRPLIGDMPDACWTQGIGPGIKKLWDSAFGTNGRGLICAGVSKFLALGVGGARVLLLDPLSSAGRWVSEVRPPTFWYEDTFRDKQAVTGTRMLELLRRAAGLEKSTSMLGQYTVPGGDDTYPARVPIFSHLVRLEPERSISRTWKGPRVGTAAQGDTVDFYEVVVNKKQDIFLRTKDGWLAPCRKVRKKRLGWGGMRDKRLRGGYMRCLRQLAGNEYLKNFYEQSLAGVQ